MCYPQILLKIISSSPYDAKKQASEAPAGPVPTIKTSVDMTGAGLWWVAFPLASLMIAIFSRKQGLRIRDTQQS